MGAMKPSTRTLTANDKAALYRDGYLIARHAVSHDLVAAALRRIHRAGPEDDLEDDPSMTALVNESSITPILHDAMGQFDPVSTCQIGINKISAPSDRFMAVGYRECDLPYFGVELHMDGALTIAAPQIPMVGTPEVIYDRYVASGPRGDLGRSAQVIGHNMTPLFQDPAMTLGLGSFTAFLFVCLNDQLVEGCGKPRLCPARITPWSGFSNGSAASTTIWGQKGRAGRA
jgi:hypothetical protein